MQEDDLMDTMTEGGRGVELLGVKTCFTPVQSRRVWAPVVHGTVALSPSMDLMVFGIQQQTKESLASKSATSSSIWLHRTVTWQKLATIAASNETDEKATISCCAWRPDGRFLALAEHKDRVTLHRTEDLLSSGTSSDAAAENGSRQITLTVPGHVLGLSWVHVGQPHPAWTETDDELQAQQSYQYRSHYLDRSETFLPPSDYHTTSNRDVTCQTPLSVLCAITKEHGLQLFLHGRYPVCQFKLRGSSLATACQVQASTDLSHLVVHAVENSKRQTLTLVSIPALARHRPHWQTISALYCSITSHLSVLQTSVSEILASFKSSLKPLDLKLDGLVKLLQKYGLDDTSVRKQLVQFILSGHTRNDPNLSNAFDQFFTSVQMNDQLLQRMERSMEVAVANVETQVKTKLISPAQALVYQTGQVQGLARYASFLLPPTLARRLQECAETLLLSIETLVTELIFARFCVRDFCGWLRSAGSQIKARGTAKGSAQRENAQARRVPAAVVQRMLRNLQQQDSNKSTSLTESILGIRFSQLLQKTPSSVPMSRPSSLQSVQLAADCSFSTTKTTQTPTVPFASHQTARVAEELFAHPSSFLIDSIQQTELVLEQETTTSLVASTMRVGSAGADRQDVPFGEEAPTGFFAPQVVNDSNAVSYDFRQWCVIAKSTDTVRSCVQLHAIPLSWTSSSLTDEAFDDDETVQGIAAPYFLSTLLQLPPGYTIRDMEFYGDDGKSSLSSGVDSGTGKEGRQSLGLLVSRDSESVSSLQLWLVPYDNVPFCQVSSGEQKESAKKNHRVSLQVSAAEYASAGVLLEPMSDDNGDPPEGVVFCKTREVSTGDSGPAVQSARVALCGSRGIGAVFSSQQGGTMLDLFDLEEDLDDDAEESDDDEELVP